MMAVEGALTEVVAMLLEAGADLKDADTVCMQRFAYGGAGCVHLRCGCGCGVSMQCDFVALVIGWLLLSWVLYVVSTA